ncbi:hypothetical protein BGZ94_007071 [Podila epigama]|nr:hypothetical protein BGZ94_007071 [Podila epigama]
MSEQEPESDHRGWDEETRRSSRSRSPRPRDRPATRQGGSENEDASVNPGNNLFVTGLASKTENADLEDLFGKYGKVEKVQIMLDPHTRESRGFAFVTMERAEDADAARSVLDSFELHGRAMSVKLAKRGRARTPTPGEYRGPPKRDTERRMTDRYDHYRAPRGPDPRDYRGGLVRDYGRPSPYDRYDRGYDPRWAYDVPPPRHYRPAPYGMPRGGYDERPSMYDRGYDRRPPARYDDRYSRY